MAEIHKGVAPFDPETPVGRFRMLSNDTHYEELNPPEKGFGNYDHASDAEIESFLEAANNNLNRALGTYFLGKAAAAAAEARLIQDLDLRISTVSRAGDLRRIGLVFLDQAKDDDTVGGEADIFEAFSIGGSPDSIGEGDLPQVGREYRWTIL